MKCVGHLCSSIVVRCSECAQQYRGAVASTVALWLKSYEKNDPGKVSPLGALLSAICTLSWCLYCFYFHSTPPPDADM